ncbi:MAG TPA: hypothetical protein PLU72_05115 [Candidatus Ozemobacteraceae bacterium]|nr:hypothetical protein [Candidatus Ozemobacteraceae bacterium]HQG28098.1 hypothetical protein [Candidatus Ozemobacteraceae bacterium]
MKSFVPAYRRFGLVRATLAAALTVLVFCGIACAAQEPVSAVTGTSGTAEKAGDARLLVTVTRFGTFLKSPDKEPLEFFRRLGRMLSPQLDKYLDKPYDAADFVPAETTGKPEKPKPIKADAWTDAQKAAVEQLRGRQTELLGNLMKAVPFPNDGLHLIAVAEPHSLVAQLEALLENPEAQAKLRPGQMMKLQTKFIPFLRMADAIGVVMSLTPAGFALEIQLRGGETFAEAMLPGGNPPAPLTCSKFIFPDSLVSFVQVSPTVSPAETMQALRAFPQTRIVESYLASAGLEFERDILSNPGIESFVNLDLIPAGDGGLPDFRAAIRVKDPLKLVSLIPQLKQLAMSVGVMVTPNLEKRPTAKISYFLLPTIGVHVGMLGEYLLISTSRDSLLGLADRIENVSAGKEAGFAGVPADAHRFWKIRFCLLNEQLQKLLQSPLLAGRGIPPLSNLNVASELGDLIMVTRIRNDGINMRLDLPVASAGK